MAPGLIEHARSIGNGRVGHFGFSMGGYFAAHSGLAGEFDAAIDLGGPVEIGFTPDNPKHLIFGLVDIFGNTLGLQCRCSRSQAMNTGTTSGKLARSRR